MSLAPCRRHAVSPCPACETRRLRAEVRRLRRALRDVRRTVTLSTSMMAEKCRTIVAAALARRRRKP